MDFVFFQYEILLYWQSENNLLIQYYGEVKVMNLLLTILKF